jgi:H+/gluconate symporter-like permease
MVYLFLAFGIGSLLKTAQGSATVAMITGSSMLAAMIGDGSSLPFHPVYVALALGAGSKVASWMNDSGFWIFAKMGGLTEVETLRSWTPLLCVTGITALTVTVVLAILVPLK